MKRLLFIVGLIIVCAALEVPEDYQWSPNRAYVAKMSTTEDYSNIRTDIPEEKLAPKLTFSL